MRIVQVDAIGLQPFQALLAFPLDLPCAQPAITSRIVECELGGNYDFVPVFPLLHPLAEGGLALPTFATGQPTGIEVCGVNQGPAVVPEEIEQVERCLLVNLASN